LTNSMAHIKPNFSYRCPLPLPTTAGEPILGFFPSVK
jgi:hypothetical protein